ncbi:hypothetical protein LTR36_002075 [Oleoguttula mirabilis]|uniref:PRISE-like Rossmann-fold domain-containing protein n=1 Tax=Oleoguttula mirabilis TaxID=1507867 RepID=A0AAV9JMA4_9PEZI|nr:hypothetical protein LTR36_002075 [Oleoguttula mirabilis]
MTKIAFITGANGISGGAILEYLVNHTTADQWSSIIVTSRSPFKTTVSDPRITFIALDYTNDVSSLVSKIKDVCAPVTHAYFCSYVHKDDFAELNTANEALFENFPDSLEQVAFKLGNVTLQTGGKYYNVHMQPEDKLAAAQKGKAWSWNVIRPEAIIGATSKPNGMIEALTIAIHLLTRRELGSDAPMPTNQLYWRGTDDVSYAPLIADLTTFASTSRHCATEAFNVTNGDYFTWRYMWPPLAAYFGVKASSDQAFTKPEPKEGDLQLDLSLAEWAKNKRSTWEALCVRQGLSPETSTFDFATWGFQDWVFERTWSATLSMNKARRFGWHRSMDSYQSFIDTFEIFKQHGPIPK